MAGPSSSRRPTRHPRFNSDDVQDPETEYEDTSRDANIENEDGDFGGDDNEEDASQDGNEYERVSLNQLPSFSCLLTNERQGPSAIRESTESFCCPL